MSYIKQILKAETGNMQPKGAVIHNTAGSASAKNESARLQRLTTAQLAKGFAHFYIDRYDTIEVMSVTKRAWHTGDQYGNANLIGYEVCESIGSSDADFIANEEATFRQVAADFKRFGIAPNRSTVRLHKELFATACPHRSWERHGKDVNAVKDYFISRIAYYMNTTDDILKIVGLADDTQRKFVVEFQKKFAGILLADIVKGTARGTVELNSIPQKNYDYVYNTIAKDYKVPSKQIQKINKNTLKVTGLADDTQRKFVVEFQKKFAGILLANIVKGTAKGTVELNSIPQSKKKIIADLIEKDFKVPKLQIK